MQIQEVNSKIDEADENIARGYAIHSQEQLKNVPGDCNSFWGCRANSWQNIETPVVIDPKHERRREGRLVDDHSRLETNLIKAKRNKKTLYSSVKIFQVNKCRVRI